MADGPQERQPWELDEEAAVAATSEPIREEERGELAESHEGDGDASPSEGSESARDEDPPDN